MLLLYVTVTAMDISLTKSIWHEYKNTLAKIIPLFIS